ncbi:aldo/keto reductase [Symbiopectobacterium purcellii]|uniref:Aldo/keto reductase n=1 Tax=Symbiopectobacterium purcellii TaxID=2871826 RepID=A0ABX9AR84_9ENTR|nr:aldo/keto reductase [Symbiopectobacterium purcellii]QZN97687.1 aldo/keto reductase [Symbiopectobacterium purcellii]
MTTRQIRFPDGSTLPAIGQGTWFMGEAVSEKAREIKALQAGLDLGLRLIDTAEMYADGGAESVVGAALRGRRDAAFLVSKVYPHNAGGAKAIEACERSLKRLQTDVLDLYLLHWRGGIRLEETITAMEALQQAGKIRQWGVSNLDVADMNELWSLSGGERCMTNQVLYHVASRGIEFDLLPWCQARAVPVMAYCPLAQAGTLRRNLFSHPVITRMAEKYQATSAQIMLAWVLRQPGVMAIPKASSVAHVEENAHALTLELDSGDIAALDAAFPAPTSKQPLAVV